METEGARASRPGLLALKPVKGLLSSDHVSVKGTRIEARASMKSFRPRDGSGEPPGPGRNGERDFRKETRSNQTRASTTDARLFRKGMGGRAGRASWSRADGEPPRPGGGDPHPRHRHRRVGGGPAMLERRARRHRITLGADKAYDVEAFVGALRTRRVSPHIAVNGAVSRTGRVRKTAIDGRTTRYAGYATSLRCRNRIEEAFGWIKAQAGLTKVKLRTGQGRSAIRGSIGDTVIARPAP